MNACRPYLLMLLIGLSPALPAAAQLSLQGQLSAWSGCHHPGQRPLDLGLRYLPQLNLHLSHGETAVDGEAALNLCGRAAFAGAGGGHYDGQLKSYRFWLRWSSAQWEIRLGLQKINFGPALLLRPLMWFDRVDPRDPLQLTDGVWGVLGRYYWLNNANLWFWVLRPESRARSWEGLPGHGDLPEAGGRLQAPLAGGEMGLSAHLRIADARPLGPAYAGRERVQELRIGADGRWDWLLGLWFEAVWLHSGAELGPLTNRTLLTLGADYTLAVAHGVHLVAEQLWHSTGRHPGDAEQIRPFSALSLDYPLNAFDRLSAILYRDWNQGACYRFIQIRRQYDRLALNLLAFYNPRQSLLPGQQTTENGSTLNGRGGQLMLIINH